MHLRELLFLTGFQVQEELSLLWHLQWNILLTWRASALTRHVQLRLSGENACKDATGVTIHDQEAFFTAINSKLDPIDLSVHLEYVKQVLVYEDMHLGVSKRNSQSLLSFSALDLNFGHTNYIMRHLFRKVQRALVEVAINHAIHATDDYTFFEINQAKRLRRDMELQTGYLAVSYQVSKAIPACDKNLRIYLVAALALNKHRDRWQIISISDFHATFGQDQQLAILGTEQDQTLLAIILEGLVDLSQTSDVVTVCEDCSATDICHDKEIVLL